MSETQASDLAIGKDLGTIVKGRDAFAIPQIVEAMDAFAPQPPGIKAAFEMALWDICGKIAKQPVHRLLGTYRESFETDLTVHLESPQEMGRLAKGIADQGFRNVKVKLGEAPALDIDRMRAIREAVGPDINLRIDANQGWSPANAVIALRGLEKYDLQFCEQPVPFWDWEGMKFIRGKVRGARHGGRGDPLAARRGRGHPARRDGHDQHQVDEVGRHPAVAARRHHRRRGQHPVHDRLHERDADCADRRRALRLLAAEHPLRGSRLVSPGRDGSGCRRDAGQRGVVQLPDTPGLGVDIDPAFMKKLQAA